MDSDSPDTGTPRPTSRRSVLGLGLGITAFGATPLGSLVGLTGEASATGHGPAPRPTDPGAYISFTAQRGSFPLVRDGRATPVLVSFARWLTRNQALLFFPMLLLEGVALKVSGFQYLKHQPLRERALSGLLLAAHLGLYAALLLTVMSPGKAVVFALLHHALFAKRGPTDRSVRSAA